MKKIYKKPTMAQINIENETLLAGSDRMGNTNNTQGWSGNVGGFSKGADDDWDEEDF